MGPSPPSPFDRIIGNVLAADAVASGRLATGLHDVDAWPPLPLVGDAILPPDRWSRRGDLVVHRTRPDADEVGCVRGVKCLLPPRLLVDTAALTTDDQAEQALEWSLRKGYTTLDSLTSLVAEWGRRRRPGTKRLGSILARRAPGAPPTESLLETLFVQLVRRLREEHPWIPEPIRQLEIRDSDGRLIARLDFAWPMFGLFIELDGEAHRHQPVYDAARANAVVERTGWRYARYTWSDLTRRPRATGRRLLAMLERCSRRAA